MRKQIGWGPEKVPVGYCLLHMFGISGLSGTKNLACCKECTYQTCSCVCTNRSTIIDVFFLNFLSSCNPRCSTFSCFEKLVPNSLSFESAVYAFVPCAHLLRSSCVKEDLVNLLGLALSHVRDSFQTNFLHLQGIAGHSRA